MKEVSINALIGKIITAVDGLRQYSECVTFRCSDGSEYEFYHHPECCESVSLADFSGDEDDILNTEIIQAEESISTEPQNEEDKQRDSFTWCFYRITTAKGQLVLRFLGESNGYYGERMEFYQTKEATQ